MEKSNIKHLCKTFNIEKYKINNDYTIDVYQDVNLQNKSLVQINQTIKKRTRNITIFEYALFLHTVKKISTKKLLSMSSKNSNKLNTLKRVHTLLVHEHNRLNKVA